MAEPSNFLVKTADWRAQLRSNEIRSRFVVLTFVLLMFFIGTLIDTLVVLYFSQHGSAAQSLFGHPASFFSAEMAQLDFFEQLHWIWLQLLHFDIIPLCTLAIFIYAAFSLTFVYFFSDRVMLLGTTHTRVMAHDSEPEHRKLWNIVEEMKIAAGMNYHPKIYIIEAPYMNAFASGLSEKTAMIAVTRGLMQHLERDELQAVVAHELSHIRHHDIRLTMTVAILSNVLLIAMDVIFYTFVYGRGRNSRRNAQLEILRLIIMVLRWLMPVITAILLLYLSRRRELMADAGSVELMRHNEPLARALLKIHGDHLENVRQYRHEYGTTKHENIRNVSYIYDPLKVGADPALSFTNLFSTHPDLEERLKAIGYERAKGG